MNPQLVDCIYECAFVPEMWPDVLGELAKIAGARSGSLYVTDGRTPRGTTSSRKSIEALSSLLASGWVEESRRFKAMDSRPNAGFLREADFLDGPLPPPDQFRIEMESDPLYRNYLLPRGLGWATAMSVRAPTDRLIISLDREFDKGPVEDRAVDELNGLFPHLARSALMAARLQLEHARAASQTLAKIGFATLVVDANRRVLAANDLTAGQSAHIHWRAQDRFALSDSSADALLGSALEDIKGSDANVRSFPVRHAEGAAALVAHVIPIRRAAQDIFSRSAAALVLTPVTAPGAPPIELVQSLFDLTPTEASVARDLVSGKTIEDIATDGGVSRNTVRSHVRQVLEKTGCNRQAEAIALLGGISPVRSYPS